MCPYVIILFNRLRIHAGWAKLAEINFSLLIKVKFGTWEFLWSHWSRIQSRNVKKKQNGRRIFWKFWRINVKFYIRGCLRSPITNPYSKCQKKNKMAEDFLKIDVWMWNFRYEGFGGRRSRFQSQNVEKKKMAEDFFW